MPNKRIRKKWLKRQKMQFDAFVKEMQQFPAYQALPKLYICWKCSVVVDSESNECQCCGAKFNNK